MRSAARCQIPTCSWDLWLAEEAPLSGERVVAAAAEQLRHLLRRHRTRERLTPLTARERDVLSLMTQGRSNLAIAGQLHIAAKTVENHKAAIFAKLGLLTTDLDNRRVLAVLTHLDETGRSEA